MTKIFSIGIAVILLSAVVHADERIDGKIASIDAAKGTIDISGVTINAKDAKAWDLIFPTRLSHLHAGWGMEAVGTFTGPREFTAKSVVAKWFRHYEIQARPDAVNAQARTLSVSGITVKVPETAKIEDEKGDTMLLQNLPIGRMMEIEGDWTGPAEFTCYSIELYKAEEKK